MVLQDHVTNKNHYVSTIRLPMATKSGRMVAYLDWLLSTKSHDFSFSSRDLMRSCDKIEPLYLHYHIAYGHRTLEDGTFP